MEYMVPPELAPGVYRHGVGFFTPGDVLTLPDAASKDGDVPHVGLIPLDKESHAELVATQKSLPDKTLPSGKVVQHPLKKLKIKPVLGSDAKVEAKPSKGDAKVEAKPQGRAADK